MEFVEKQQPFFQKHSLAYTSAKNSRFFSVPRDTKHLTRPRICRVVKWNPSPPPLLPPSVYQSRRARVIRGSLLRLPRSNLSSDCWAVLQHVYRPPGGSVRTTQTIVTGKYVTLLCVCVSVFVCVFVRVCLRIWLLFCVA